MMTKLHFITAVLLSHILLCVNGESTNQLVHWISYLADRFINRALDIDLNHLQRNHWIFCNVRKLQFPVAVESFKDTTLRRKDVSSRISCWTRITLISSQRKTEYLYPVQIIWVASYEWLLSGVNECTTISIRLLNKKDRVTMSQKENQLKYLTIFVVAKT